jgi:dihydrofolate reductase
MMAAYWPTATDNDPYITQKLNALPKIVFSRTLKKADWAHSTILGEASIETLTAMKQASGRDMVVLGSSSLASLLLRDRLVDEFRIRVQPVVLGAGRPLFRDQSQRSHLKLISAKAFKSGVLGLHYEPAR